MEQYRYTYEAGTVFFPALLENALFLDIETTGFLRESTFLTILGLAWQEGGHIIIEQWFNGCRDEPYQEEKRILLKLKSFLEGQKKLPVLVHYNGQTFDLPYLKFKENLYRIQSPLADCPSLDLYQYARKYKALLSANGLKQKNMEEAFGLLRKDSLSGKELIAAYRKGIRLQDKPLLDSYLLHNKEDMEGMIFLQTLFNLDDFFNGKFEIASWRENKETENAPRLFIELTGAFFLKEPVLKQHGGIDLYLKENRAFLQVPSCRMEAKYFYPDYHNYYYLPIEDRAIHKSVASFVEKEFRQKATKENCYIKKSGSFYPLPLPKNKKTRKECLKYFRPFFRAYGDSKAYIQSTAFTDTAFQKTYAACLLQNGGFLSI